MASKEIATTDWDYCDVPAVDARRCRAAYDAICKRQRRMASDIIAIGNELLAVKARLEHGQFTSWVKHHFDWSMRTAQRMMGAAEVFGKNDKVSLLNVDQSALYLLSDDSCPDEVREQLLEEAQEGDVITHSRVKQAISEFSGDDDDREPPQKQHVAASEPDSADTPCDVIDDEIIEWSLNGFLLDVRECVKQWANVCPESNREDMVEVLRDIADQIEHAWENDASQV